MSRPLKRYTLAEARYVLSHVYCVLCVPEDGDAGFSRPWVCGAGIPECCKCACTCIPDLRLWIASEKAAAEWLGPENEAVDAYNASLEA